MYEYPEYNERYDGPIEKLMDDHPELCIWSCCSTDGNDPGCQKTPHKSKDLGIVYKTTNDKNLENKGNIAILPHLQYLYKMGKL